MVVEMERRLRSSPLLLGSIVFLSIAVSVQGGSNTTWVYPTLGCSGYGTSCFPDCEMQQETPCDIESVCQPIYLKGRLGSTFHFDLAATDPTPFGAWNPDTRKHCNKKLDLGAGETCDAAELMVYPVSPNDEDKECCGLSEYFPETMRISPDDESKPGITVNKVYPEFRNLTWVSVTVNVTDVEEAGVEPIPLFHMVFSATYAGLKNASACNKTVFFQLCALPIFDAWPKFEDRPLEGNPAEGMTNTDVDCDEVACLRTPGMMDQAGAVHVELKMGDGDLLAGETYVFNVSTQSLTPDNTVELQVMDDPGLPIGMLVGPNFACGSQKACRTVTWTPGARQVGTHHAYFVGKSFGPGENPEACGEVVSNPLVVTATVQEPHLMWQAPAADISEHTVIGTEFVAHFECLSNYHPVVEMVGEMQGAIFEHMSVETVGDGMMLGKWRFSYTPMRGEEGSSKGWSFTCGDSRGIAKTAPRSIMLNTRLCIYTVQEHDTLQSVTRRYHLSTNWLNVWNANPTMILDPDLDIGAGKQIKVGPVYESKRGDTLSNVAAQFSTTVKKLLSVNPHLMEAPDMEVGGGVEMCILACTNEPAPSMSYKWAY
mmetsp:Transcript_16039/g.32065  ORF Transcript_16039/g.32065 Transcript_16039/m.32065 type:complete len:599 (+) Transcript_16039:14-1810(+)